MTPSSRSVIRIVIADDHEVVRVGLRTFLERQPYLKVVGEAGSAGELLEVARTVRPDVIITDLRMPGADLTETIRKVRAEQPGTQVLVFSAFDEPADASLALRAGAAGYVLKQSPPGDLVAAIRRVCAGGRHVDPRVAVRVIEDVGLTGEIPPRVRLSLREARVLDLVSRGYTGPQIAVELGVSSGTVDSYRHRIRKKLGLKSRSAVTAFARAFGHRWARKPE